MSVGQSMRRGLTASPRLARPICRVDSTRTVGVHVYVTVLSNTGREAVAAMLGSGDFFSDGSLAGQPVRMASATAITPSVILRIHQGCDGQAAPQAARDVGSVHHAHAGAE